MLKIENLDVDINSIPILRNIELNIETGEIIGLIGRNGAGKTTFLRSIMGLLPARSGKIFFNQKSLHDQEGYHRAHLRIGYLPEDRRLVPDMTSEQNILLPVWATNVENHEERLAWIYKIIPECETFRDRPANSLSGGQQKLVALARALMVGHRLLLLDEPTEGIAPVLVQRMIEILNNLKKEGVSIIVAESNDAHIGDVIDRLYVIERGSITVS
jgi:branched-chain amino acid transport system ATP-binding protein